MFLRNPFLTCLPVALALTATPAAWANEGLVAKAPESVWPQWQARISVQTASISPLSLSLSRPADGSAGPRVWQGGSVLGDYFFATPGFGSFRASGGLISGIQGGTPMLAAQAAPRLGVAVVDSGGAPQAADGPGTLPYLGLGFSGGSAGAGLSVSADLGLVAGRPGAAVGVGRALFGNQGFESALREMRLSPVLQLGVRYTF